MKKFCDRVTKQQWRVTVPNINTKFFKKREETSPKTPKKERSPKTVSGSYDLQAAQREFDRCRSLPNGVVTVDTDSSDSESFQDARMSSDKRSSANFTSDDDVELYVDVDSKFPETPRDSTNAQFEYDVPKISFSFFENGAPNHDELQTEYAIPQEKQHKSEVVIVLASPGEIEVKLAADDNTLEEEECVETKTVNLVLTKDLHEFPTVINIMKSGSDPNICYRYTHKEEEEEAEEEFYKVPVPAKRKRLSQSLTNVELENFDVITSNHSSIEHISCSQILAQKLDEEQQKSAQNSDLDYCKVRSKLPLRLRRATLLRKPKAKAVDTWVTLRTKFNSIISEHASQQRVGAYDDKDKLSINIEEVYKSSKDKCKKVLKSTGKIFNKNRKNQENVDPNNDTSSQIVRNNAFFAKVDLKASDIEYKLNYNKEDDAKSEKKETEPESPASNSQKSFSRSVSDEKREEFDFNTIKSAFRRSRVIPEVSENN